MTRMQPKACNAVTSGSLETRSLFVDVRTDGATLVHDRLGGLHSARCLLASVEFADIETLQVAGKWEEAGRLLADAARDLEAGGADVLLQCTNTMHKVADQVQAARHHPAAAPG